jgi:hypothetical protein
MNSFLLAGAAVLLTTTTAYCGQMEDQLGAMSPGGASVPRIANGPVSTSPDGRFGAQQYYPPSAVARQESDRDIFEQIMRGRSSDPACVTSPCRMPVVQERPVSTYAPTPAPAPGSSQPPKQKQPFPTKEFAHKVIDLIDLLTKQSAN